jgi:hypothetical protein
MELLIPGVALYGLYKMTQAEKTRKQINNGNMNMYESFSNYLPNTDVPDKNFPPEELGISTDTEKTSQLSTINKYDTPSVYTDKYFPEKMTPQSTATTPYYSMSGEKVNADYFEHNNMTPFFGAKRRTNILNSDSNEGMMDAYNGSGSQFIKKQENAPLFSPGDNYQYAYGAPNQNDFYQSRVNPSLRMANVKPFQEQQVAPGLGLGYTTEGSGGYNSGMALRDSWLPKTVDELRVDTKLKASGVGLFGHEGPANSSIKTVSDSSAIGHLEKNRVERTFDMGPERYFTTTGLETKPAMKPIQIDRYTNRPDTTTSYMGVAGAQNEQTYNKGTYMESKHMDLGPVPFGVARAGKKEATDGDYGIQGKRAYPNNRSTNTQDTYFGAFSGAIGAVVAPILDELRPSRRQNAVGTLRPYQNPHSEVPQSYLFNPADRPAPTIRETTEQNKFTSGVNRNQNGGAYSVTSHQPVHNQRETTSDFFYAGNASATERTKSIRPYDSEYQQRNNDIKSSTIQGYMVQGNMNLMNSDIHMRNRQGEIPNQRALAKTTGPTQLYSTSMMGENRSKSELYSTIQMDRNSPEILQAFHKNPYTHSLTNVA